MKILKYPTLLLLVLCLFSCSSDDDGETLQLNSEVIGIWDLVEVNVSSPQDIDNDGNSSTNLMDELDCIMGTLLIDGDLVWTLEQSIVRITTITGGQFVAECGGSNNFTGTWNANETSVSFRGDNAPSPFQIVNGRLVDQIGEDLPGIQSFVYELRQ